MSSCKCVTIRQILARVTTVLNDDIRTCVVGANNEIIETTGSADNDTIRWPTNELLGWMNEALSKLQSLRPDAFTETIELRLEQGPKQRLPPEYDKLVQLDFNIVKSATDSQTQFGAPIIESDEKLSKFLTTKCAPDNCIKDGEYEVSSYSINQFNEDEFYVTPPVPANASPLVCATVVKNPCQLTETDLDECFPISPKYQSVVTDWVLHRATSKDMESTFFSQMSQIYRKGFYDCVTVAYNQESRFGSGNYLGERGDGDERVT